MAEKTGVIYGINGPVIYMKDAVGFKMAEMVYVGEEGPARRLRSHWGLGF